MGTVCVGGIIIIVVGLIIRSMILDRKNGKSCGGSCASCKGCGCSHSDERMI